jgi:hypothetical protein
MEGHDRPSRAGEARDAEEEAVLDAHPARGVGGGPEDPDFAEGIDRKPDSPEEELEPDFARGIRSGPESDVEERRRFSEGIEQEPADAPDKSVERRFSEGIEESPTSE